MWIIICVLTMVVLLFWIDTRKPKGYPPGPKWIPFIGIMPLIKKLSERYKFYHEIWNHLSRIYGPVCGLRLGGDKIVIVSGRDAIKEFYSNSAFDGRPDGVFWQLRTFGKKLGVVFTEGPFFETQKKFTLKTLKNLGYGKNEMVQQVEREAYQMVDFFREKSKFGEPVEMHSAFDLSVLNVMWCLLAGYRFDLEDERLPRLMEMIHNSFRIIDMSGGILNMFPFLRHIFPEATGYASLLRNIEPIWKFLRATVNEIRVDILNEEPKCLIKSFLLEMQSPDADKTFTDEQLLSVCVDFFQAGSETTSNTLSFAVLFMANYPEIQFKIQNELNDIVGRGRLPSLNDRPKLKYTEAVIREIQRFINVAPLAIAHKAMRDTDLQGWQIPKNTNVIVSLISLHMEKDYWKDPEVFRPERFLDNDGNLINFDCFLPFGAGRRRCIGENLAKPSLFLFFSSFVHAFDLSIPEGDRIPKLEALDGITLSPKPYKLILHSKF